MNRDTRLTIASVFRWGARGTSLLSVGTLVLFLVGEPWRVRPNPTQLIGLLFFPFGLVVGLLLAWWREGAGVLVTTTSLAAFYFIYGALLHGALPRGPWFIVFASPALLFLGCWLLRSRKTRR